MHFITFATVDWVDALSRPLYNDIVASSLTFCQKEKGLLVYAWCIMSNHFHMIASTKEGNNLSDILRDFKKHTSKRIMAEIEANPQESRKNWMV
jgi:putative transposase